MLNFTNNTEAYTTSTRTRTTNFLNFTSKKQLLASDTLNATQKAKIQAICNLFTVSVHNKLNYACITLYYSKTKSYAYIVLNLNNGEIAEVDSIATAKAEVELLETAQVETEEENA